MKNFRGRILNSFIIFTSGIFLLLGIAIANLSIGSIERALFQSYKKQLELIAYDVINEEDKDRVLQKYHKSIGGHLTYISEEGTVDGTTFKDPPLQMLEGLTHQTNQTQMMKTEDRINFVRPLNPLQPSTDYLVITINNSDFEKELRDAWSPVLITLFLSYLLLIYITFRLTGKLAKPVDDAMRVAKELARGNFKARSHEYQLRETGELNHSLNILARNLEQITELREAEQERMKTVIENMDSGLLLIDALGYIHLMNRTYRSIFEVNQEVSNETLYYDVMPNQSVIDLVEETFLTEATVKKQVSISVGIDRKHFHITCVPILGFQDKIKGIVLVFHDITELKHLEQMRKDFVANVSHELRTPVTSLKGFAETLLDGAMDDVELRKKFLSIIWKESDRLQNLIQDLLDFTKMEQSNFKLNWQTVNLATIIDDVTTLLETKARKKELKMHVELSGSLEMDGDAERLKQILINLINNALSYTPSGGEVWITGKDVDENIELYVKDTGIGITDDEVPRIFERFYRVDKARSRNSGGTGLGLAIVKHLVEAHKGSIKVTSQKDKGTTFQMIFSKKRKD
ncbi:two-component system histidine kinase PnpS [Pseudalkalibacillus berkeleyi]|uniref:histidine kinase n=1 Tax=Pseudalkalibacillus berkeleyi TaxID=1069813 RepID=A0ABS9H2Q2_9BACL|nr:HAMP domain-containing sensor histidine kinase [Pseudalkalibacillus berkeleyi]MCF6138194.1 ATP-binding protein [Pseudalkalibacillus berkeleyi]